MIRLSQLKLHIGHSQAELKAAAAKKLRIKESEITSFAIFKRSIDARDKRDIQVVYSLDLTCTCEARILKMHSRDNNIAPAQPIEYKLPVQGNLSSSHRPCVIGAGPAGLFCAYFLAENGYRPILIEQGEDVESRQKTVEAFWQEKSPVNPQSNIQFGEGGAGTFSDGKLVSGVKDISGRKTEVLRTFARHGAPIEITYSSKPHVGTDVLRTVVKSMREEIIRQGGEVLFNTKFTGFTQSGGTLESISIADNNGIHTIPCDVLVLATGHSSRETYKMLYENGVDMEAKSFAVGVRVEHLQDDINKAQYGEMYAEKYSDHLPAADYKLTTKTSDGHAVYSFCMCPGGYVVNSSSEEHMLCVNGMSYSGRDGLNANSAIVVTVTPEDTGSLENPLNGIEFQRTLESRAYDAGNGRIPVQLLGDFNNNVISDHFGHIRPQTKGYGAFADLNQVLPDFIRKDLKEAFTRFGSVIKGYDSPDTILEAVETRTSSPVRINRDLQFESNIKGIYPCGEGAGYAGGITSSAIDGIKVFEEIYKKYRP